MGNSIQAIEQKTVDFYGDSITAVRSPAGDVYVPVKPIVEMLGINWSGQYSRINRDEILNESRGVCIIQTPGGAQEMLCLPLETLPGFLFGISTSRVKPELKESLLRYKRECHRVLSKAFISGELTYHAQIMDAESPAARAYQIATALQDLARYQWVMEKRIDSAESQLTTHDNMLADYGDRIESLESQLTSPEHIVNDGQASQISQAVKAIALELGKRSGRNEYGGVYGELYRRFEITSYKNLHATKFDDALGWLTNWYQTITDSKDVPF